MIITSSNSTEESIKLLLNISKDGQKTFRYFKNRNTNIISNHLVSKIFYMDNKIFGYYHIELEKENYWFGILIADEFVGKGFSKILMQDAINESKNLSIPLTLTVDKNNLAAFNLYKKYNFVILEEKEEIYLMKREI